jgi:hypothetical protein
MHPQISVFMVWAPLDNSLPSFVLAKDTALAASWNTPPDRMDCIQSAAFQKDRARKKAFANWEHKFGLERCLTQFRLRWLGDSGEGHAYREHIITEPPSVGHHPLWAAATEVKKDDNGKKTHIPKYSRPLHICCVTTSSGSHAFTGTYARRFPTSRSTRNHHLSMWSLHIPGHHPISFVNACVYFNTASTQVYTPTAKH